MPPCFQHFTVTLLKPGAASVTAVSPCTSEQYSGETTDTWQPNVSSRIFSESALRESKYRSPSAGNSFSFPPALSMGWPMVKVIAVIG